jgi:predicted ArsR family transcriptional regulator
VANRDVTRADTADGAPALGSSRTRVLSALHNARSPIGVAEVAERVGLHPNTARFHLDGLVEHGLAARAVEEREVPGRPRALYTATADSAKAGRRSYRLLAEILTSYFAAHTKQPRQAALKAGEAWGRFLTEQQPPFRRTDAAAAVKLLVGALDDIGFAPEAVTTGRRRQILLHQCPFRETAEAHGDVVCSVHLGLMRGMLRQLDAPIDALQLDPFVEPDLCVTHLVKTSAGRTSTSR